MIPTLTPPRLFELIAEHLCIDLDTIIAVNDARWEPGMPLLLPTTESLRDVARRISERHPKYDVIQVEIIIETYELSMNSFCCGMLTERSESEAAAISRRTRKGVQKIKELQSKSSVREMFDVEFTMPYGTILRMAAQLALFSGAMGSILTLLITN